MSESTELMSEFHRFMSESYPDMSEYKSLMSEPQNQSILFDNTPEQRYH
jgi:hypothetical protein